MRYIVIGLCFMIGCKQAARTAAAPPPNLTASTVFADSTLYRARCKEADALVNLTVIPRKCTPRDQRLDIR